MPSAAQQIDRSIPEPRTVTRLPTPTSSGMPLRLSGFATLVEALDYAAAGRSGLNFYSGRLDLLETLSYRDLRDAAIALARKLLGQGLVPGDRVALVADTGADFVTAFAACQYARLLPAPLPVPPTFGGRDAYAALVRQLITGSRAVAALAPSWLGDWLPQALAGLDLRLCATVAQVQDLPEAAVDLGAASTNDISYLQFSSGSTRTPTGVAITHRALMANAHAMLASGLAIRPGDRATSWLPFYHDMGLVGFVLAPVIGQMSVDYLATRDFARRPLGWLSLLDGNGGTVSFGPSFGYELCSRRVSTGTMPALDLSRWRVAGIGGDMIRPHILRHFADTFAEAGFDAKAFLPSYGMAETTLAISFAGVGQGMATDRIDVPALESDGIARPLAADGDKTARGREFVICGTVIPGHQMEIRDEDGNSLEERQLGRIWVRGPSLMTGYDNRPEDTAHAIDADGWLDTGDLGYLTAGQVVVTGRAKDVVIINGRNIWPQDVEHTVELVEGVRPGDAATFSLDDGHGEHMVVLVQCRTTDVDQRQTLTAAVAAAVSKVHGIEPQVVLIPNNALPMTSSGKLSRTASRKAYLEGRFT